MQLILVNGKKRSGKDFFAQTLKNELAKVGKTAEIMSFAGPLKEIIAETFDITLQELDDYKNDATPVGTIQRKMSGTDYNALTDFRLILQKFGTEAMKKWFGEEVWVKLLAERAYKSTADFIIVPDFRFLSEEIDGAITVKIRNADFDNAGDLHRSETELDNFEFMYAFDNTGYPNIEPSVREFVNTLCGH
jgi:hypothetical protein